MNQPLHIPLDRPPQVLPLTVRALLQRVVAGGVRIPEFQRPLRWRAPDVVKLFDSLLRGYPVGALLFWRKSAPGDRKHPIGSARLSVPATEDAWYIVDGQQRTTALAAGLLDLDQGGDLRWTLRYDPTKDCFLSGPPGPTEEGMHVPLNVLGDLRRLGRWLRETRLTEDEQTRVEEVQQRLLDYQLSAYVMETDQPDALKGVFARLNSSGVRMRSDEVFQALLGAGERRERLDLNALQACCNLDDFGQPPRSEILKAVLAVSGVDPTQRLEAMGEDAASRLAPASAIEDALVRAVEFLSAAPNAVEPGAGIPCYAFIPYPSAFAILARFFHVFPHPEPSERARLAHWLWRGVLTGTHQRAEVTKLRLQVRLIKGDAEDSAGACIDRLLNEVEPPARVDWQLERFNAKNARSRVELLCLLECLPRYRDGSTLSWQTLVSDGERVAREIIPSTQWKDFDRESKALAKTAANRALLDARHTGLHTEFREWSVDTDERSLESHLIDAELHQHLTSGAFERFLRRRADRLRTKVSTFLTRRAGLSSPVLRPVQDYFEDEAQESEDQ